MPYVQPITLFQANQDPVCDRLPNHVPLTEFVTEDMASMRQKDSRHCRKGELQSIDTVQLT